MSSSSRASSSSALPAAEAAAAGLPRDIVDQMASQAKLVKQLQSSIDSMRGQQRNSWAGGGEPKAKDQPKPKAHGNPKQREVSAGGAPGGKRRRGGGGKK